MVPSGDSKETPSRSAIYNTSGYESLKNPSALAKVAPHGKISSLRWKKLPPQLNQFQIQLEEQHRIYFAGDEIKGHVQIDLSESLPIQGIILRIVGEAYVNVSDESRPWTTRRINRIRATFRNRKISPSPMSEQMDADGLDFFSGSDSAVNWGTAAVTTVTQRSTLQCDQNPPPTKSRFGKEKDFNRKFTSQEKYFEHRAYLFGHKYSSTREMMWMGKHSFPFSYCLPSKLPASFHGRFGYVRYFCEASLERHNLPTVQRRAFFSVNKIVDLNTDSKADSGISKEKKTNSWCFCCASGTIIVSVKVRKRGYVPGETIPIQAHILNISDKTISKISAKIVQIATYYSSKAFRNRADETVVCEKMKGKVPPGESSMWEDIGPRVPPIPPSSTMIDCKLITLEYRLDFELKVSGMKESLVLKMPLRIGSIPLEKTFKRFAELNETDDSWTSVNTPLPLHILLKYPKLPVAYSLKCIKGERNVNRYYFRQIPRSINSIIGINLRMPNAPVQPLITDESETYAPRYLTYREMQEETKSSKKHSQLPMNGGSVASEKSHFHHMIIQVTPAFSSEIVTPSSTIQLVSECESDSLKPVSNNGTDDDCHLFPRRGSFSAPCTTSRTSFLFHQPKTTH